MAEWNEVEFQTLFEIPLKNGLTKPSVIRGQGVPMINMKEIFSYDFIHDETPMEKVPLTEKEHTALLMTNDLLFARQSLTEAGAGKVSIYTGSAATVFESHLIRCRLDPYVADPLFMYYYFKSTTGRGLMSTIVYQTAAAGIKGSDLKQLLVPQPPLEVQRAIASVLSSLDAKIDLLHRQNKTLEAMAETLFRQWFVEEAEKGWVQGSVSDLCTVVDFVANGSFASLKANVQLYDEPEFALFVRTTDYTGGFAGNLKYTDKASFDFLKKSRLHGNEVIISNVGNTGTVFRPPIWLGLPMTLGSNAVALLAKDKSEFLYYYFSSEPGQGALESIVTGSAQPKFNKTNLRDLEMVIPPDGVIQRFEQFAKPIREATVSRNIQIRTLTAIRDTLLPKLMSGEVRVDTYTN